MERIETNSIPPYVIVSPVKDEERYVEFTLRSVTHQTIKPILWIIVDDGSKDNTAGIVKKYAADYPFIKFVHNPNSGVRQPGSAVIRAFNFGCETLEKIEYDFIVKLDCDLSFEPDYIQLLLGKFMEDNRLGIASGIYLENQKEDSWTEVSMPSYHAAGACKVLRRQCFKEIGGFISAAGWDTVDEIRAITKGWETGHFANLRMKHHKIEGSGIGPIKTGIMHGEIYYLTGGSKLFFILKAMHRLSVRPYLLNALALSWGYLNAAFKRKTMLVTKPEAKCYQSMLHDRLRAQMKTMLVRL